MKRLIERLLAALGIGLGWCGGCSDPDCMDCQIEWTDCDPEEVVAYDGFGAPIMRFQVDHDQCRPNGRCKCYPNGNWDPGQ